MKNVERVVLWRPEYGLDTVIQQAGRAGRQGGRGLVVIYGSPNLKKAAEAEDSRVSKRTKEVQAAITACGPTVWSILSEKKCIRDAIDRHYDQMPLPPAIRPKGAFCCNLCRKVNRTTANM